MKAQAGFQCDDAVKCVFNLNNLDIIVYKTLKKQGTARADELADLIHKERSTVYRSLQKLMKCGMCIKKTEYIKKGGYYHIYKCCNSNEIKKSAEKCLENWYNAVKQTLSKLSD